MKQNRTYLAFLVVLMAACSSTPPLDGPKAAAGDDDDGARDSASGDKAAPAEGGAAVGGGTQVEAGVLTAGVWDDNRNFELFREYLSATSPEVRAAAFPSTDDEHGLANARWATLPGAKARLDVALVLDTTGSMTDELSYLQAEFDALSASIRERFPSSDQRWSLVLYRDEGDQYVTRGFDFVGE